MKTIRSKDNPAFRNAMKLLKKKHRDETGRFLLEGVKPVRDAIARGTEIRTIFFCEGSELTGLETPESETAILDRKLFRQLSDTETSQGVIAVADKPEVDNLPPGNIVVFDRLQDPGNIGTIIRTAEAAGFAAVVSVKGTGDIYSPKTVRSAAGSLLRMPVMDGVDTEEVLHLCKDRRLIVTALEGAADYTDADWEEECALVIGNEGQGVSSEFMERADIKVKIPMRGEIESLNAAVAAGILMYHAAGKVK